MYSLHMICHLNQHSARSGLMNAGSPCVPTPSLYVLPVPCFLDVSNMNGAIRKEAGIKLQRSDAVDASREVTPLLQLATQSWRQQYDE